MGLIPPYYRDIWSHKTSKTLMFLSFARYPHGDQQKITCLFITHIQSIPFPYSKIRLKKLVPLTKVSNQVSENHQKKSTKPFSNSTFCSNRGFQKPGICPRQPPRGGLYFQKTPHLFLSFSGKLQKHQKQ